MELCAPMHGCQGESERQRKSVVRDLNDELLYPANFSPLTIRSLTTCAYISPIQQG